MRSTLENYLVTKGQSFYQTLILEEGGAFYEMLVYPRRRAGEQTAPLVYTPQFPPDLGWQTDGIITTDADFPSEMHGLNPVWEQATSRRPIHAQTPTRGFARMGVGFND